jgi:hypothetical protein
MTKRVEVAKLHVVVAWRMKKVDVLHQSLADNVSCIVLR